MGNYEPYSKETLAQDLLDLVDKDVASGTDLESWYQLAEIVHKRLANSNSAQLGPIPELVWHYLSDADIRFKDSEYASAQNRMMQQLINQLKRGNNAKP